MISVENYVGSFSNMQADAVSMEMLVSQADSQNVEVEGYELVEPFCTASYKVNQIKNFMKEIHKHGDQVYYGIFLAIKRGM